MDRKRALIVAAVLAATPAAANPLTDSGSTPSRCTSVRACLERGYVLRTTTSYVARETDGLEYVTVAHFLQDGTRLVVCYAMWPTGQQQGPSRTSNACVAPDW